MALLNIRLLTVCISLLLIICRNRSYTFTDLRGCILENKELAIVAFTLMATIIAAKIAFMHQTKNLRIYKRNDKKRVWLGFYIITTAVVTYLNFRTGIIGASYRMVMQLMIGICFLSLMFFYVGHKQGVAKQPKKKHIDYKLTTISSRFYKDLSQNNLVQIIEHATKCIRFVDNLFVYKKNLQNIIGKFYEWTMLFSEKSQPQIYESSQPTEITLDELIGKVESALIEKIGCLPRLLIKKQYCTNDGLSKKIVCNVNQMICLLVTAVLRIANLDNLDKEFVKLELYSTHLQVHKSDPMHNQDFSFIMYRALALVLSSSDTPPAEIPKVKSCYRHVEYSNIELIRRNKIAPNYTDPQKDTIESLIDSNYGYIEYPKANKNTMLLVVPADIESICKQTINQPCTNDLKPEVPIMLKEEADSMIILMQFCDFICRSFKNIKAETIGGTLLLLKRRFGTKQHASGALFYIRAVEITRIITKWIFQASEPIYVCLLYDLVRYTDLPLAYIKDNYNSTVHALVQSVLNINTHQTMASSLPRVKNHYKKAVDKDHPELFVLYIKLAERLYDLRHAENYTRLEEVKYMATETLKIDIKLAKKYLDPAMAEALEIAAKHAEAYLARKGY